MLKEAYNERFYYQEKVLVTEPLFLSLFLSNESFIYAISTHQYKTIIELCHVDWGHSHFPKGQPLNDKIAFLVQNYGLNQKKFEKTNISILNTDFSMVPEAYASEADFKKYLLFSTGVSTVKKSPVHRLKDLIFCYGADTELINYLERTFVNASIRHSGAVNLQLFFNQHSLTGSNLFLTIHEGAIELCAKQPLALLFYNVYNYSANEDILYYLLFAMEQFELKPMDIKLSIACQKPVSDELITGIKKYIKQVSFCVSDPSIILKGSLESLPKHYYFTLLNQHLCEL